MDRFISLKDAADLVGVSRPTLFRAVQRAELPMRTAHIGKTKKILVSKDAVLQWASSREHIEYGGELVDEPGAQQSEQPSEQVAQREHNEHVPLVAHLDLVRLLEDTQVRLLDATERAHRAERQADLMRMELGATRNVLTEQAQSHHERQAELRQLEATQAERDELVAENRRRQELWEAEKAQLVQDLHTHQNRVNWLEKRVPQWVRKVFGA